MDDEDGGHKAAASGNMFCISYSMHIMLTLFVDGNDENVGTDEAGHKGSVEGKMLHLIYVTEFAEY